MSDDKVYAGTIKFGETTNSYDADGELVSSLPVPPLTLEQLEEAAPVSSATRCKRRRWCRRLRRTVCLFTSWRAKASKWSASPG